MKKTFKKVFFNLTPSPVIVALILLGQLAQASSVGHPIAPKYVDGSVLFDFKTSYFKSEENFDSGGSKQSLTSGNYLQVFDMTSHLRWGFTENLGFYGGFNVGASESNNTLATRKNSTLNEVSLGGDFRILSYQAFDLFTKITYIHPIEKIDRNTDSVMNSNGASQIIPEIGILMPFGWFNLYGMTGYNYRSEGLSGLVPYRTGIEMEFSGFSMYAGLDGFASVTDDKETSTSVDRDIINNRVNAGSKKYFAVNPNEMNFDLGMNWQLNANWGITGFGQYTVVGSNTSAGYTVGAGFTWELGRTLSEAKSKIFQPKKETGLSRDTVPSDFTEDTNDGVNQDYFKQVPSPTEGPKKVPPSTNNQQTPTQIETSGADPITSEDEAMQVKTKKKKQDELKIKLKRKPK